MGTRLKYNQLKEVPGKKPCRVATTATVTLSGGAPDTVDGISLAVGDRVLVRIQNLGSENGIYEVTTLGTGSNGTWERAYDFDTNDDVYSGVSVYVSEGTTYGGSIWNLSTVDPIVLDTTALTFTEFSGGGVSGASNGLSLSGSDVILGGTLSGNTSIDINNATRNFKIHNSLDATGNDISAFEYGTDGKGGNYVLIGGPVGDIGDPDSIPIKGVYLHSQDLYFIGSTGGGSSNQITLNIKHDSFSVENNDGGAGGRNSSISFNVNSSLYLETLRDSGGSTSSRSIDFGSAIGNEFLITDNDTSKGLVYAADYSDNYTTRSLVDKAYVDNSISAINIPGGVTGSGTASYITKWTGTDTISISNIYDDGTNVGIGETSNQGRLHVTANTNNSPVLVLDGLNDTAILGESVSITKQADASTTGTNTVIAALISLATGKRLVCEGRFIAYGGTTSVGGNFMVVAENVTGTAAIVGSDVSLKENSAGTPTVAFDAVLTNVRFRATGGGENLSWLFTYTYEIVDDPVA